MQKFSYQDIVDMIWGSTLLGGGGGGSMLNGMDLLQKYMADHGLSESDISVDVIDPEEMEAGAYAAVTAGMGAPTAIKNVDFSKYATNTFEVMQDFVLPKKVSYSMAVELGGFNTFVPMLISLVKGIPFIDTDGAARAVPALSTLLLHVNGVATSPLVMANAYEGEDGYDQIAIKLKDAHDAGLAENLARGVCVAFKMLSGLCGWMMEREAIREKLPVGTVSLSRDVGNVLRDDSVTNKFEKLAENGVVECRELTRGAVTGGGNVQEKGFDFGFIEVTDAADGTIFRIEFQNENLVLSTGGGKIGEVKMTCPDIICCYNSDTSQPLTNADFFDADGNLIDQNVVIGAVKVDEKWWMTGDDRVSDIWKEYFGHVGYDGPIVKY